MNKITKHIVIALDAMKKNKIGIRNIEEKRAPTENTEDKLTSKSVYYKDVACLYW